MKKYVRLFLEKVTGVFKENEVKNIVQGTTILAVLMEMFIESMSRHSVWKMLVFLFTRPHLFLYNTMIILFTLSVSLFFRKRVFVTVLVLAIWGILGIGDGILLVFRKTPLTAQDFGNAVEAVRIMPRYLSIVQIILLGIFVALVIGLLARVFVKSPEEEPKFRRIRSMAFAGWTLSVALLITMIGQSAGFLGKNFGNIAQAYHKYGFGYCFASSIFGTGVSKPENYSEEAVVEVLENIEPNTTVDTVQQDGVNVIFLQLESLFDPTLVKGITYSEDPIPFLHHLYANYSQGYLSVPSFGAGTANTEFEVITGMNLDDFGPGEYPYKTVLKEKVCESVAFYMKEHGYTTFVLHDNAGDFYGRNEVFPQLGFDSFTSLEYMNDYELTPTGWAKDTSLIPEIVNMIKSTDTSDFIYTISVEGHGDYPQKLEGLSLPITLDDPDNVTGSSEGFRYYVNQIHEMDAFVEQLVHALEQLDEDVVLVMYGDHLPTFELTDENLVNGDIYQTQYVIWDNIGLEKKDRDVEAFQLSSLVLERLNLPGDVIYKLHTSYLDGSAGLTEEQYLEDLKLLEYDLLYEDVDAYDGVIPYQRTMMKMGYKPIVITDVKNVYNHAVVEGENFTLQSIVFINGERRQTVFNGPNELILPDVTLKNWNVVEVRQQAITTNEYLSSTEKFRYLDE